MAVRDSHPSLRRCGCARRQTEAWLGIAIAAILLSAACARCACAGTIVLANRTRQPLTVEVSAGKEKSRELQIASGDVASIRAQSSHIVRFSGSVQGRYAVEPNAVYFFAPASESRIELSRIGFGGDAATSSVFESDLVEASAAKNTAAKSATRAQPDHPQFTTIPVKIFVDDEEAATQEEWERRLRRRMAAASAIFEQHCFVRFEVVAIGKWQSNNEITDFEESFADFEAKVSPRPARLAIGFTGQYRIKDNRPHLGGTRGPMHSHMLVREWSNHLGEGEKLEVLVHELGHFLGAVHSPEKISVMRPILGDKQARAAAFRIGFDPVNTLSMCLVSDAMHTRPTTRFADMDLATQLELQKIYREMGRISPDDPSAVQYVGILEDAGIGAIVGGARQVVAEIGAVAEINAKRPKRAESTDATSSQVAGDALTELYVRHAAAAAERLPANIGPRSFLLALGIGLDRTALLEQHRLIGPLCKRIESEGDRKSRIDQMGVPTMFDRHELARHFAIAAALTAIVGPGPAEQACLASQLGTSEKSGSFSAAVYQADLAGIVFAYRVLSQKTALGSLAQHFEIASVTPKPENLDATLSPAEFRDQYGTVADPRFRALRAELGAKINAPR